MFDAMPTYHSHRIHRDYSPLLTITTASARLLTRCGWLLAPPVHGDVELTHLRQFGLTHLFQVARSWRAPSSLVDADRGLCHLV